MPLARSAAWRFRTSFEEDLTQREIAERCGVSQMNISRLLRRSLERLRALATEQEGSRIVA